MDPAASRPLPELLRDARTLLDTPRAAPDAARATAMLNELVRALSPPQGGKAVPWLEALGGGVAALLAALPDGIMVEDAGGSLVYANARAAQLMGFSSPEELVATPVARLPEYLELLDAQGCPLPFEGLPGRAALRGERPPERLIRFRIHATGEERWAAVLCAPLLDATGGVRNVLTHLADVTEREATQRVLRLQATVSALLSESLDVEATLQAMTRSVVPSLADWCAVDLLEPDGVTIRLVAVAHVDPEKVQLARQLRQRYPPAPDAPTGTPHVLRTGEPELVSDIPPWRLEAIARDEEHLRLLRSLGLRSYMVLPLKARGRLLGTLILVSAESQRRFGPADLCLAQALAERAALAVDNARLYAVAQEAARRNAQERDFSERLARIGTAIVSELDHQRLVQRITDEATALVGARFGAFFWNVVNDSGEAFMLYTLSGAPREAFAHLGMPRATAVFAPTFRGERIIRSDDITRDPRYGQNSPYRGMPEGHLPVRSYLAVPVRSAGGEVLGGIFFGHPEPGAFTAEHERLVGGVAAQAAVALQNASLYAEARRSRERLQLALEAGRLGSWEWHIQKGGVKWSAALEVLHGLPSGGFEGTFEAFERTLHPEDRPRVLAHIQRTMETRQRDYHIQYRVLRPDGAVRWLEGRGQLELDAAGAPLLLRGVCSDITERVETEEAARRLAGEQAARSEAEAAHRRTQQILESITAPFFVLDGEERLVYTSGQAREVLQAGDGPLLGRPLGELLPEAYRATLREALREVRARGAALTLEDVPATEGRSFEVHVYPAGEGVSVYFRDVTARRAEEEIRARLVQQASLRADVGAAFSRRTPLGEVLRECAEALVRHLEVTAVGVWALQGEGPHLELQGSAGEEPLRAALPSHLPSEGSGLNALARASRPLRVEDRAALAGEDGLAWARAHGVASLVGCPLVVDGRVVGALVLLSRGTLAEHVQLTVAASADVMAQGILRYRAQHALEAHARELARSNEDLQQFAYVASHDLQEPLRVMGSYAQLLARRYKGQLDAKADGYIHYLVDGATRMQTLINDLLAYSRVGTQGREFTATDSGRALAQALENLRVTVAQSGAEVSYGPLPRVMGDPGQLVQLFQNLIGNAIKFRRAEPPRVRICAERRGSAWEFAVEDNGIGIAPEYFQRIFVIFQRLHHRSDHPGNGIGLAICKKIVERHGGTIWIDSTPGKGSTFRFTLRAAPETP